MNEIEVFFSTSENTDRTTYALQQGKVRRIVSNLYTTNLKDELSDVVKRNLWQIVGGFCPRGLISDRTALENKPSTHGAVYLIGGRSSPVKLPGYTIIPRTGPAPLPSDREYVHGLHLCSPARALLENMRPSRRRGAIEPRTLSREEMEIWLDRILRTGSGERTLNQLRDEAREIAMALPMRKEMEQLDRLIGAMLGSRQVQSHSDLLRQRTEGRAYDPDRLPLFEALHQALVAMPPVFRPDDREAEQRRFLPFFEAFFSNFIEGTRFEIQEAREIIFEGKIPANRPKDSHDILGTFRIVANDQEMMRTPKKVDEFFEILKHRHAMMMGGRPESNPGEFKRERNQAGATSFVAPDRVLGTLRKGFEFHRLLPTAFQRAVFMAYLITEVHPFTDGNGRMARVMMNAELHQAGEHRIIVPTVFRTEYVASQKALSQNARPDPFIQVMDFAQRYTALVDHQDFDEARLIYKRTHAFEEASDVRLILPNRLS